MIMMIHVCQGLTQDKLCTFLLLKNQKDVLWWALACAASRQMPSGQAPVTLLQSLWIFWSLQTRQLNYINVVCIKRNNKLKQKAKRHPGAVAKSTGTAGENSVAVSSSQQIRAIHQERNKDKQSEKRDIKKPGSGFGRWHLIAVCSQSRHCSKAPRQGVWQTAAPAQGCTPAGSAGAKETAKEAAHFHSPGSGSVYPHPSPLPGQASPPALFPTHKVLQKGPCPLGSLGPRDSDHPGHQGCWWAPTQTCGGICCWQLLQRRRMVMEMNNGTDDLLVNTLCYPSWALLFKIQMILIISGAQAKC